MKKHPHQHNEATDGRTCLHADNGESEVVLHSPVVSALDAAVSVPRLKAAWGWEATHNIMR